MKFWHAIRRGRRLAGLLLACLALGGCANLSIFGGEAAASSAEAKLPPLTEGENRFLLEPYALADGGLTPLLDAVAARCSEPPAALCDVGSFSLTVDGAGRVVQATVSVTEYPGDPPVYDGGYTVVWTAADRQLIYTRAAANTYDLTAGPNDNLSAAAVDRNLCALPVDALCGLLPDGFTVSFQPFLRPDAGTPIVDMRAAPAALDPDRYAAGDYGTADGGPQWMLTVWAEDTALDPGWPFCFAPEQPQAWIGRPDLYSQCDVAYAAGSLRYTRDWGETWQDIPYAGLAADCVEAYGGLTRSSWSVWPEDGGPVALLLGEEPWLVWSMDGTQWSEWGFPAARVALDRRTALMLPNGRGVVSYGGAWTMGSGGFSALYFTGDAGATWTPAPTLPDARSICGAGLLEDGTLLVTTETPDDEDWPAVFLTTDDGATWTRLNMPWIDAADHGVSWLYRLESLTRDPDGRLRARFTQEPMGTQAVEMTADDAGGYWSFDRVLRESYR